MSKIKIWLLRNKKTGEFYKIDGGYANADNHDTALSSCKHCFGQPSEWEPVEAELRLPSIWVKP